MEPPPEEPQPYLPEGALEVAGVMFPDAEDVPGAHRGPKRRSNIGFILLIIAIAVVIIVAAIAFLGRPKPPRFTPEPGPGAFRGLGTWVDVFEEEEVWSRPEQAVADMKARGVRTIYLQTSNYGRDSAVAFPAATGRIIDAAHAEGMDVVGWYFPGWTDHAQDRDRVLEGIGFRSETGEGFDAFGIDIEPGLEADPEARTKALLRLSRTVRSEVGDDYPLGAISPNPMRIEHEDGYWPGFPYAELSNIYDAFLPMDYFGAVDAARNKKGAYRYTFEGIRHIRENADRLSVPIHVIGGLAEDVTAPELEGFLKAVDRGDAVGYSLYTFSTTRDGDWVLLTQASEAGLTDEVGRSPSPTP